MQPTVITSVPSRKSYFFAFLPPLLFCLGLGTLRMGILARADQMIEGQHSIHLNCSWGVLHGKWGPFHLIIFTIYLGGPKLHWELLATGSPVEDQDLVIDRFSHQGKILFTRVQAQTTGGQALSFKDLPRPPRCHIGFSGERRVERGLPSGF